MHAVQPFPWQDRLLHLLAENGAWPEILNLPTGSGKTAALDIAVFHLAMDAHKREPRTINDDQGPSLHAPVRIAFVVDRRLIVDDAFERAQRICNALVWSLLGAAETEKLKRQLAEQGRPVLTELLRRVRAEPVVARVAGQIGRVAERSERPLLARRLRGGVPREDDWARTPSQPTILCSTVDQVGSRLLFRGYGVSDRMKPVHAGLLGSDCLILLDEAHLAEPFRQTLAGIRKLRPRSTQAAPWQVALLSATPGVSPKQAFSLDPEDHGHPVLARRLAAAKPTALIDIPGRQGVSTENRRLEEIVSRTKEALAKLCETVPNPAVGVILNRVSRARAVFGRLEQDATDIDIVLLIGPARASEREQAASRDLRPIKTGEKRVLERPLVVVATQTIEAGVDIDFDGLITEVAAFDALRQRFGRLNRDGRAIAPVAAILAHKEDIGSRADDAVYGDRIRKTWEAMLRASAGAPEPCVDFGYTRLPRELTECSDELATKRADAPILLPAYLDLWTQTWPLPNADPAVSLFLHGSERAPASVQVVWRADLNAGGPDDRERIAALLELVPPRAGESVEIPLWVARAWLRELRNLQATLADVAERTPDEPGGQRGRRVFRYAGSDTEQTRWAFADELRNGDLIIAPASYGGCDQWGWAPDSTRPVLDLAETAALPFAARRFAVRVTPELIRQWLAAIIH
ncbi:MAG TPA: type I-U CRISPR-associated helicase/endonuclease Cas3 [Stellaceae bacterium]